MSYVPNNILDTVVQSLLFFVGYVLYGLALLAIGCILISIVMYTVASFYNAADKLKQHWLKINATINVLNVIGSIIFIALYKFEPYKPGFTRMSGVCILITIAITIITFLIGAVAAQKVVSEEIKRPNNLTNLHK